LVYFPRFWYIFLRFGIFHREKSGNPGLISPMSLVKSGAGKICQKNSNARSDNNSFEFRGFECPPHFSADWNFPSRPEEKVSKVPET
jgi:hypothetical protein